MTDFITWEYLATYAGATVMVYILVQFTKEWGFCKTMPTQLWSFILTLGVMLPATYFTIGFTTKSMALVPFNAIFISLAANGGSDFIKRVVGKNTDGVLRIDTTSFEEKDVYRIDLGDVLSNLTDRKTVTLKVDPEADLSHKEHSV